MLFVQICFLSARNSGASSGDINFAQLNSLNVIFQFCHQNLHFYAIYFNKLHCIALQIAIKCHPAVNGTWNVVTENVVILVYIVKCCWCTLLRVRGCVAGKSSFDFRRFLSFNIIRAAANAIFSASSSFSYFNIPDNVIAFR